MNPVLKACIVCAKPFAGPGSRCPNHALPNRTGTYTRTAKQVVANATHCHLCGGGPRPDDPFVADHIIPRSLGGNDAATNLLPAHRSCNGARGNKTKAELNWRDRHPRGVGDHREIEVRLATPAAFREKNSARNRP